MDSIALFTIFYSLFYVSSPKSSSSSDTLEMHFDNVQQVSKFEVSAMPFEKLSQRVTKIIIDLAKDDLYFQLPCLNFCRILDIVMMEDSHFSVFPRSFLN